MVTEDHRTAFTELKKAMRDSVFISAIDRSLPFVLRTDASTVACGFELVDIGKDGKDIPILCGSHKFSARASDWHTIEQKAYAILWAVLCCADLLYGIAFVIETNHRNLQWMNRSINKKVLNWSLHLQNFGFTVRHIPGVTNSVADALSRLPQYSADVKGISVPAASNSKGRSKTKDSPVLWSNSFGAMAQRNTEQEGLRLAAKPSTNYVNMNSLVKVLVTDVIVEGPVKSKGKNC
jgi:hypothetical protein